MSCAMTFGSVPKVETMQVLEVLPSWNETGVPRLPFEFVAMVIPFCRGGRATALPTLHLKDGRLPSACAVGGDQCCSFLGSALVHPPSGECQSPGAPACC